MRLNALIARSVREFSFHRVKLSSQAPTPQQEQGNCRYVEKVKTCNIFYYNLLNVIYIMKVFSFLYIPTYVEVLVMSSIRELQAHSVIRKSTPLEEMVSNKS